MGKKVRILSSGCAACRQMEANLTEALRELGMDETVEHPTEAQWMASYGIVNTPALVVDGKVVSRGQVLDKEEILPLLKGKA